MGNDFSEAFNIDTDEGLTMQVAILDDKGLYDEHRAMWWDTDSPIPLCNRDRKHRKFRIAVPIVWKAAPEDTLSLMLQQQVLCWHNYPTLEGKELKTYLQSQKFVKDLRRLVPHYVASQTETADIRNAMRKARMLLSDRPSKTKDIIVTWRDEPADLMFSPIASTNPYARVIWLDPALMDEDTEMLDWVIYHEMCVMCALSYTNGKPKKTGLITLEDRFPYKERVVERMDALGWSFEYDTRKYKPDKGSYKDAAETGEDA